MSLSLSQKIQAIYPQLKTPEDWDGIVLLNTLESDGDYIDQWNHSSFPKPTQEQLDSVNETEYCCILSVRSRLLNVSTLTVLMTPLFSIGP